MKSVTCALFALLVPLQANALAAGDAVAGQATFDKNCGGCHKVGRGAQAAFGPQLNGVIGRAAGSTSDYSYSAEMKNSGIVWTAEKIAAFVEAPSEVVPGTKMRLWWFGNDQKMADLLEYLKSNP
jgi:cytochrome c